ncbi:MAG: hypothetical protein JWN37_170 [Candidatus Nomurabacteria bacterium]|nr:hypothetical protein [Candidatus Nomurabacteria bacterium]
MFGRRYFQKRTVAAFIIIVIAGIFLFFFLKEQAFKKLPSSNPETTDFETVNISNNSSFSDLKIYISNLIHENKMGKKDNSFCIIGYRKKEGKDLDHAFIYWSAKKEIIYWGGETETLGTLPRDTTHLDTDIGTPEEIYGSTYMVTQDWVDSILNDCEKSGLKLTIPKT